MPPWASTPCEIGTVAVGTVGIDTYGGATGPGMRNPSLSSQLLQSIRIPPIGSGRTEMERLSARDLGTVLEVACELGAVVGVDRFRASLLLQLKRLVSYDIASWNVVLPSSRQAQISAVDPADCRANDDEETLGAYLHQNPLVATADPTQVVKFSDFITLRQLHRLELYDAVYRRLAVEHQIAFLLPAPRARRPHAGRKVLRLHPPPSAAPARALRRGVPPAGCRASDRVPPASAARQRDRGSAEPQPAGLHRA